MLYFSGLIDVDVLNVRQGPPESLLRLFNIVAKLFL